MLALWDREVAAGVGQAFVRMQHGLNWCSVKFRGIDLNVYNYS